MNHKMTQIYLRKLRQKERRDLTEIQDTYNYYTLSYVENHMRKEIMNEIQKLQFFGKVTYKVSRN